MNSDDPGGQHRAVGNTLLGLGAVGLVVGFVAVMLQLELRFIDARTMALFGLGMAGAGLWQRAAANKLGR
ncbi:hypothetical protein BH11MYX4_BH11MYX4_22820 [soil metagenome]